MRSRHLCACLLAAAPILAVSPVRATAKPADPDVISTPSVAPIAVTVSLRSPHERRLRSYAASVSTPGSGSYRRFLSATELRRRYGAPQAATRVAAWARAAGLRVGPVDATGTRLPLSGTAATVGRAFGVTLSTFRQDGVEVRGATAVRLPAGIAADVAAVAGLNEQPAQPMHLRGAPAQASSPGRCPSPQPDAGVAVSCMGSPTRNLAAPGAGRPLVDMAGASRALDRGPGVPGWRRGQPAPAPGVCATAWAYPDVAPVQSRPAARVSVPLCGYTGSQLRSLYGLTGADDGAGQTIVIVGAFNQPSTLSAANAAFAANGVAALAAGRYQVQTYRDTGTRAKGCNTTAWGLEQAIDVQTVHTIAPAARIVYAAAPDCTRLTDTLGQVIADPDLAGSVVSSSWGYPAEALSNDELTATDAILARAAVLGTGTYTASGIYGSGTSTGILLPDRAYPASSPWTTAVGGTTTAIGADGSVLWQTGWADTTTALSGRPAPDGTATQATAAVGGGFSLREPRPAWQPGGAASTRQVPDLAALADPHTGFAVGTTSHGRFSVGAVGGTSLATPIVASLAALAQARTGHRTGLISPLLWKTSSGGDTSSGGGSTLTDVRHVDAAVWTPQTPTAVPDSAGYPVRADTAAPASKPGWDPVTGLGAPGRTFLSDVG